MGGGGIAKKAQYNLDEVHEQIFFIKLSPMKLVVYFSILTTHAKQ